LITKQCVIFSLQGSWLVPRYGFKWKCCFSGDVILNLIQDLIFNGFRIRSGMTLEKMDSGSSPEWHWRKWIPGQARNDIGWNGFLVKPGM